MMPSLINLFNNAPKTGKMEDLLSYYSETARNVEKTDAPYTSTTSGFQNANFGENVFMQVAKDFNLFSLLPKFAYSRKGYRALTADASDFFAFGADGSAFPEEGVPTMTQVTVAVKEAKGIYAQTLMAQVAEGKDDDIVPMAVIHNYASNLYSRKIADQIGADNGTTITTEIQGLDRVCGSYAEVTNASEYDDTSYTAGDLDIYSQDRDAAASWADASVDYSTSDRTLSIDMIRDRIYAVKEYQGKPTMMITGFDTAADISGLVQTQERYNEVGSNEVGVSVSLNGVSTVQGINASKMVSSVYNVPIFESQHVVAESSGSSRIYGLDTSVDPTGQEVKLGIKLGLPTIKVQSSDYISNDASKDRFGLITLAEVECHHFRSQFKIRDLS